MTDQAQALRLIARQTAFTAAKAVDLPATYSRIITVTSGKGGVGKTSLVVNLATALAELGKKVAVLDADLGLANVDIMLGISPRYNLKHVLDGACMIEDILVEGPSGVTLIPGASGLPEMADLEDYDRAKIINKLSSLENLADILLIDTGAGLSRNVLSFAYAAQEVLVVTTPEPTAITDAYGIMKTILEKKGESKVRLVLNMVSGKSEGEDVGNRLSIVIREFLKKEIEYLGCITSDHQVSRSIKLQKPVLLSFPRSPSAHDFRQLAAKLSGQPKEAESAGIMGFFSRLLGNSGT